MCSGKATSVNIKVTNNLQTTDLLNLTMSAEDGKKIFTKVCK